MTAAVAGPMIEVASAVSAVEISQRDVGGRAGLPSTFSVDPGAFDQVFYKSREPHPDWIRKLRQLSPKSLQHGWLFLDWDPGEPWSPRQRWVIDELVDPNLEIEYKGKLETAIDPVILAELRGPHPRSSGHMCHWDVPEQFQCMCKDKHGRPMRTGAWRGGPCDIITLRQWQLYKKTGMFANPFWVIQGGSGGHQTSYSSLEKTWLQQSGLPTQPPAIGELAFAPVDGRVFRAIGRFNRLMEFKNDIGKYRAQQGAGYAAYRSTVEKEQRRQWVTFLEHQTREEAEDFQDAYRKGEIQKGGTSVDWERVDDLATNDFIETGAMHHTSAYLPSLTK